jgi:hypothetical protein
MSVGDARRASLRQAETMPAASALRGAAPSSNPEVTHVVRRLVRNSRHRIGRPHVRGAREPQGERERGAVANVRIAVIGGLERHESEIQRRAGALGHYVEFHRGRVGGRHTEELEAMVQRCELAVIVTQVNSHGAMYIAKRAATRSSRPALITRTCGPSRFSAIVESLETAPRALAAGA